MNTSKIGLCVQQNDRMAIRLSEYFVYDVMAHFFVHDVVALNSYFLAVISSSPLMVRCKILSD